MRLLLLLCTAALTCSELHAGTLLVLQFHNSSQYSDLGWVGESIAETLMDEMGGAGEIVLDRTTRSAGLKRLELKQEGVFTKASLIKLGQALDVDYVCYGTYDVTLSNPNAQLKDSSILITERFLDLRKMHDGSELSEKGNLSELSRLEEHLAWQTLKYLEPETNALLADFLSPQKLVRLDAKESYTRGLLSTNREQQQKWFTQAVQLDSHFSGAAFELGKLELDKNNYKQAMEWFQHIPPSDPRYAEARFKMGLGAYGEGNYSAAVDCFKEVLKLVPLGEVYNDLGAAEDGLNHQVALDDFRKALDGDPNDSVYLFNLGVTLLKYNYFDEAAKRFEAVLSHSTQDKEAATLLGKAVDHEAAPVPVKSPAPLRLKENFDETAFRQLKAMLQPKGKR